MIDVLVDVHQRMARNDGIFVFTGRLTLGKRLIIEEVFNKPFITEEQRLREFVQSEEHLIIVKFRWLTDGLEREYICREEALRDMESNIPLTY